LEIKAKKGNVTRIINNKYIMQNKDYVIGLLEKLESKFSHLEFIVSRQEPLEVYKKTINESREIIENIKSAINR
jgi:hypothetical protein|tara:strand:+ start:243 stop:464 length:222 start_codon:yes stop_codon:yes gene_type:complete